MFIAIRLPALCALVFLGVIAAAEGAARLLAAAPASDFLWFLNLAIFRALRPGLTALGDALGAETLLAVIAIGAALALAALFRGALFLGALLSNLGLTLCGALWGYWRVDYLATHRFATNSASVLLDPVYGGPLLSALLAITLAGALASHIHYLSGLRHRAL